MSKLEKLSSSLFTKNELTKDETASCKGGNSNGIIEPIQFIVDDQIDGF